MFLRRNTSAQSFIIPGSLRAVADGSAVTVGSITILKDGTGGAGAGTLTHISGGAFLYTPTAGETDCKILGYVLEGTGAVTVCGSIRTTNADPDDGADLGLGNLDAAVSSRAVVGSAMTLAAAGLDAVVVEAGVNARQALAVIASAVGGVLAGAESSTITLRAVNNSGTSRGVAMVDGNGNRTAVTWTPPA